MSGHSPFQSVTAAEPCAICETGDWCRRTADGAHECHRVHRAAVNGYARIATTPAGFTVYRCPENQPLPTGRSSIVKAKRPRVFKSPENAADNFARWKHANVERIYRWSENWCRARIQLPDGNGKTFCEITLNGTGWVLRGPPKPHPLYRVGELPPEGIVIVCEGEKACDAGWSVDLPCVTSGAADSARIADWTSLGGRDVAILPDHDEPGARYAGEVARQIKSLDSIASVRIIELPELEEAEDLHDFINKRRNSRTAYEIKAEIVALIASTPAYDAPNVPDERAALDEPNSERVSHERFPIVRCVADVKPETVEWLWQDRIAIGKVTLIAGDPGLGKSFVTLDIVARVSAGVPFHDTLARPNPAGGVVLLSAEDDVADTLRPRLDAAGADVRRIVIIDAVAEADADEGIRRERTFNLEYDIPALERAIHDVPCCRLVIVDPITAYCGKIDSHKNAQVRGLLAPLSSLAARRHVAIVCVTHLNKSAGGLALYRAMGSLAFTATARAVWIVARDPADAARRLMLQVKNNLGRDSTGIAFQLVPAPNNPTTAVVRWEADAVTLSADEALSTPMTRREPTERDEAAEWLQSLLADGPMLTVDVKKNAKEAGYSFTTVRRAKDAIGVKAVKAGFDGRWFWQLPGHGDEGAHQAGPSLPVVKRVSAFRTGERLRTPVPKNAVSKPCEAPQPHEGAQVPESSERL